MVVEVEAPFVLIKPGVSEAEFYTREGEDSPWEYLDGRLVMMAPASRRHEILFSFLLALLRGFLDEQGGGVVIGSRYPMRLDERWSPEPDLLVVRDENRERMTSQRLDGPADLVIEIASEGDPKFDLREKLPRYREAGIPEMWFVDPFEKQVRIFVLEDGEYSERNVSEGRLEAAILPGFWIEVDWLWQDPLPSTLRCLQSILDM